MLVITYTYDILGRPTARNLARYGTQTSDTFGYNTRSESPRWLGGGLDKHKVFAPKGRAGNGVPASQLTTAHVNSADYSYAYDAIGNRAAAVENSTRTAYTANKLNQYTAEGTFTPFDADGNQTLIKTSTGIRNITYNAKNRPILFTKSDGSITVECTYDTLTEHRRFFWLA